MPLARWVALRAAFFFFCLEGGPLDALRRIQSTSRPLDGLQRR